MSAATVALAGRTAAERLMVDTCAITRSGGADTFDPDTGEYTTPAGTTIYAGACQVQLTDSLNASTPDVGGEAATISRLVVKVPMSVEDVQVDDVVTITASLLDPDLVGRRYRVASRFAKTFATARRLEVEETSLAEEPS